MAPRIQYAKTADGVSIAYWKLGEGMPLVHLPPIPFGHAHIEWQFPEFRSWYERLAKRRMLVRYDGRGSGLSERNVDDFSLDARLLEIESVVDRLNLSRFAIFGPMGGGTVAIAYAAKYPERVSHVILWNTGGQPSKWLDEPGIQDTLDLAERNWELAMQTLAHMMQGWAESEAANRIAAWFRESITPETFRTAWRTQVEFDVSNQLAQVKAPTLVLNRPRVRGLDVSRSRDLASRLADARLVLLEGTAAAWYLGDTDAVHDAIDEFLGEGEEEARALPEGMTAILFLDIADSTALTTKLGDAAYREKECELDTALRQAIRDAGGTPVEGKLLGDGVMAVFTSARQAIDAAQRCRDVGNQAGLPLHLGIHAGDVVREGNNVHGGAVQLAARVQSVAEPGEILVSQTVRDLARTSADVQFEVRGEHELKGIPEPQRLFAVQEQG